MLSILAAFAEVLFPKIQPPEPPDASSKFLVSSSSQFLKASSEGGSHSACGRDAPALGALSPSSGSIDSRNRRTQSPQLLHESPPIEGSVCDRSLPPNSSRTAACSGGNGRRSPFGDDSTTALRQHQASVEQYCVMSGADMPSALKEALELLYSPYVPAIARRMVLW